MLKTIICAAVLMLCASVSAQNATEQRSDRKIIEISKIVKLSPEQEAAIRNAYDAYNLTIDSALYVEQNPVKASRMKYAANKTFYKAMMGVLNTEQRNRYIQVTSVPDVEAKTEYNISLLREGGEYTESELSSMKKDIFKYLMREKVVYMRDKYDVAKQKDNIRRLKETQPKAMKESNIIEKMKVQGRLKNGKMKW